jgi:hypothetical protein
MPFVLTQILLLISLVSFSYSLGVLSTLRSHHSPSPPRDTFAP